MKFNICSHEIHIIAHLFFIYFSYVCHLFFIVHLFSFICHVLFMCFSCICSRTFHVFVHVSWRIDCRMHPGGFAARLRCGTDNHDPYSLLIDASQVAAVRRRRSENRLPSVSRPGAAVRRHQSRSHVAYSKAGHSPSHSVSSEAGHTTNHSTHQTTWILQPCPWLHYSASPKLQGL